MRNADFNLMVGIAALLCLSIVASATDKQTILYSFKGEGDGAGPESALVSDAAGNLYGTTYHGGSSCDCGTVFELSPVSGGGWTKTILHIFTEGNDGAWPFGALIFDSGGNLYGETVVGGPADSGTIFELSPNSTGGWTEAILYAFKGAPDGREPSGGLAFDASGNLYGTTFYGGTGNAENCIPILGCGTVFELSPMAGSGWTETVLYNFTASADGNWPSCSLVFDTSGNLYGTASNGGDYGAGTVLRLSPSSGGWTLAVLYSFTDASGEGQRPEAGLLFDHLGNLYGTTAYSVGGNGAVFELSPPSTGTVWQETVLHSFTNADGYLPDSGLIMDRWGSLYGTSRGLGFGPATAFKLNHSSAGWTFGVLHNLPGDSWAPLIRDAAGNLYGTTQNGGQRAGSGTVFELSPVK